MGPSRAPHPARRAARLGAALVLALVAAAPAACKRAAEAVFARPAVTFRGVSLGSVGIGGGSLDVALGVANPNPYTLTAKRMSYRLMVGDSTEVARGATTAALSVAGHDSAVVRLPLDVSWRGLSAVGKRVMNDGTVDYRLVGEIVADTPVGEHAFPVDQRGRFAALSVSRQR
ncbi:MAG: LEA type 2 family protein [Gemmatimonadaceae bacterium]